MVSSLVSTSWVKDNIDNPDVKIIDASWHMIDSGRTGAREFQHRHIKGASFFDLDVIADTESYLPHMTPDAETFSKAMSSFGVTNEHHVIVYDDSIFHSGLRLWWMFRAFGHEKVSYMDGGLSKWLKEGLPVVEDITKPEPTEFTANLDPGYIRNAQDIFENITSKAEQLIDARTSARFTAEVNEPRVGLRSGHIPGSINIPFEKLYNDDNTMKDAISLLEIFNEAGTDFSRPLVTTCGSGVTACSLIMALNRMGRVYNAVYDGSWVEWGGLSEDVAPVVTGK